MRLLNSACGSEMNRHELRKVLWLLLCRIKLKESPWGLEIGSATFASIILEENVGNKGSTSVFGLGRKVETPDKGNETRLKSVSELS